MFIDYVEIDVASGAGGPGRISFRREKHIAKGGPDGGSGGRGGSVWVVADENIGTLLDFRYHRHYKALPGEPGGGALKSGRTGEDVILRAPVGTVIKNKETGETIIDLNEHLQEFEIVAGGRGGKGNDHFKSATNQAPRQAEDGRPGQKLKLSLELRLLADVGLVGYPNAGKSTLLSHVTAAKPKIADYPFTTLVPNLGIVKLADYRTFVMADIPGIIEGASQGKGLGFQFLRHIQRTAALLFMIDGYESDVDETFEKLRSELEKFDSEMVNRKIIKVINKIDIIDDEDLKALRAKHPDFLFISAVTGAGLEELLRKLISCVENEPENEWS